VHGNYSTESDSDQESSEHSFRNSSKTAPMDIPVQEQAPTQVFCCLLHISSHCSSPADPATPTPYSLSPIYNVTPPWPTLASTPQLPCFVFLKSQREAIHHSWWEVFWLGGGGVRGCCNGLQAIGASLIDCEWEPRERSNSEKRAQKAWEVLSHTFSSSHPAILYWN
jgi:hypothetical protein